uniref:Geranylgeranyl transferase type I subunit beta n=1 Tax=Globodera rostochiensis TaxID=31243 RepID=A0A914HSC0_GLORO
MDDLPTDTHCGESFVLLHKHTKLIRICLDVLPSDYAVFQTTKPTILFFMLSGLDLIGQLDTVIDERRRKEVIDWIYALQLPQIDDCKNTKSLTNLSLTDSSSRRCGGFRGSILSSSADLCPYDSAHLAQTYTSLCILLILGDDLSRLDRRAVLNGVARAQGENGSFFGNVDRSSENDMRFLFCASAICYILDDFSQIDIPSLLDFVRRSVSYDGGIAQGPTLESHGGSTFCAVAALCLIGHLWDGSVLASAKIERMKSWAVLKQEEGFHGRTNKSDDSCYAFWVGATLAMLNALPLADWPVLRSFLLRMQDTVIGGFRKHEDSSHSDLLHTYFSLAALGMFGEPSVRPIFAPLNISIRAHEHLHRVRRQWHNEKAAAAAAPTEDGRRLAKNAE